MTSGDDKPRMLDDYQASILEQYGIGASLDALRERWMETNRLQKVTKAVKQSAIAARLRAHFETLLKSAIARMNPAEPETVEAVVRARERLQLVSNEHPPLDSEMQLEFDAVMPVLMAVEAAISKLEAHEVSAKRRRQVPVYRRRPRGGAGYHRKGVGYVPGDEATGTATMADKIWFERGADPLLALYLARAVMACVRPTIAEKNRRHRDVYLDHIVDLLKHKEVSLPSATISKLLLAIGYDRSKVNDRALNSRASRRPGRSKNQPVATSKKGRRLGRPRGT